MAGKKRIPLVFGILALSFLVLIVGTALLWIYVPRSLSRMPIERGRGLPLESEGFRSNGEHIYFTGTSRTGPPITVQMVGMHRMFGSQMACASCHGAEGRGGRVRMMMTSVQAPNIRWEHLTEGGHEEDHHEEGKGHPPYTEESLKRAIREGVNPAGEQLHWMMPRWKMTEAQLDDLVGYLKTWD